MKLFTVILFWSLLVFGLFHYGPGKFNRNDFPLRYNSDNQFLQNGVEECINISSNKLYHKEYVSKYYCSSVFNMTFNKNLYHNFKISIYPDTLKQSTTDEYIKYLGDDKFNGTRLSRWYYGWIIFKEYPWYKKIFGGGFDYLELFGKKFKDSEYDYPHNPFISAFLFSGIVGGLVYIWFMFLVFYYYIKYYKHHVYFFICFLVVFFFSFFSANTHFSIPIFAILSIIPFHTRYLVEKSRFQAN